MTTMLDVWSRNCGLSPANECTAKSVGVSYGSGIISSADECTGRNYCSNPEWFEDNVNILKPLIDNKNEVLQ